MKAAIYARVSTDKQNYENQLFSLKEYCKNKGYSSVEVYEEAEHGNYPESKRPGFLRIMDDAAKHKFDVLVVWALDRFTREGVSKTHLYIDRLQHAGVSFISYQEPYLNTTEDNPFREVVLSIMAYMAAQERVRISERTKASLDRAKREIAEKGFYTTKAGKRVDVIGKKLSYPTEVLLQIQTLKEVVDPKTGKKLTVYKIAKLLNLNSGKVDYAIKKLLPQAPPPEPPPLTSANPT